MSDSVAEGWVPTCGPYGEYGPEAPLCEPVVFRDSNGSEALGGRSIALGADVCVKGNGACGFGCDLTVEGDRTVKLGSDRAHVEMPGDSGDIVIRSPDASITFGAEGVTIVTAQGSFSMNSFARFAEVAAAVDAVGPRLEVLAAEVAQLKAAADCSLLAYWDPQGRLGAIEREGAGSAAGSAATSVDTPPGLVSVYVLFSRDYLGPVVYTHVPVAACAAIARLLAGEACSPHVTTFTITADTLVPAAYFSPKVLTYRDLRVYLAETVLNLPA